MADADKWLDQCRTWCREIKYLSDAIGWQEKPSRSEYLEARSVLLNERRVAIPNLYFKGEYSARKYGEVASYALMHLSGREWRRVFMLEVYPKHKISHKEQGLVCFGPHISLGDDRLAKITKQVYTSLEGAGLERWIRRFRAHAKILDAGNRRLAAPYRADLFGRKI